MAALFEAWLVGADGQHLAEVAEAAFDEIERIERLLSRFDPRSEIARINRLAAAEEVLVDREVFAVLESCDRWRRETGGWFDIAAGSGTLENVQLDGARRTVRFTRPDVVLDLGGVGKGYALDCAAELLGPQGVAGALLHGGSSSVLARGVADDGQRWPVGIRDPWSPHSSAPLGQLRLSDCGLSCSATRGPGQHRSDVLDPRTGEPLEDDAACVVIAPTASEAEVLSTALLCMGKAQARAYTEQRAGPKVSVAWIDAPGGTASLDWFREPP